MRIVILSSQYMTKPSANGLCAKNIVEELCAIGNDVHVIAFGSIGCRHGEFGEIIHFIQNPDDRKRQSRLGIFGEQLRSIVVPPAQKSIINGYYEELMKIQSEKPIDGVIAMFFPMESLYALEKIKKRFARIKTVAYELDSVGDGIAQEGLRHWFLLNAFQRIKTRIYHSTDLVVVMKSHMDYWNKAYGNRFSEKMVQADIPVLKPNNWSTNNTDQGSTYSFLYAGLLDSNYRSPVYMLQLFEELSKKATIKVDFYSKGNCEDIIAVASKTTGCIYQHGYVSECELREAVLHSDFLVSIGNSISRSLPSKVINYVSYGKPIIHFSTQEDDVCAEYLCRYPNALIINKKIAVEANAMQVLSFIKKNKGKVVSSEYIGSAFYENTPKYSAELISDFLSREGKV